MAERLKEFCVRADLKYIGCYVDEMNIGTILCHNGNLSLTLQLSDCRSMLQSVQMGGPDLC